MTMGNADENATLRVRRRHAAMVLTTLTAVLVAVSFTLIGLGFNTATGKNPEETATPIMLQSTNPFYVLLIGSDSRKETALYTGNANEHAQVDQHADVMTLMRVDPGTHTLTLVTVPCDTVPQDGDSRINNSLIDGDPEATVHAVEGIVGIDVSYYFMTDFASFENLINSIDGVQADVRVKTKMQDPLTAKNVTVKPGTSVQLNGAQALVIAHAWTLYDSNQDANRQINVREIEAGIIDKVLNADESVTRSAVASLEANTQTNMDPTLTLSLVADFWRNSQTTTVYSCTGPYQITVNEDGFNIVPEQKTAWRQLMSVVDAGADPEGIIPLPTLD